MEHNLQSNSSEIRRALKQTVDLDDGRRGYIFTEIGYQGTQPRWLCHICCRTIISERTMALHIAHPLHNRKLLQSSHPHTQFKKFASSNPGANNEDNSSGDEKIMKSPLKLEMVTDVVPGEPVPPGMEDIVEGVCQIQSTIDAYKENPLIGLEYIVELISTEDYCEPRYICLLCEKKGDPRSVMVHVTSQNHYLKYISCFFRTAGNALNMIPRTNDTRKGISVAITKVAAEIERNYGRLKPTSTEAETFMSKKYEILRRIDEKEHFRETPGTTFAELVTMEKIREYNNLSDDFMLKPANGPPAKKEEPYNNKDKLGNQNQYNAKILNPQKKFSFTFNKVDPKGGKDNPPPRKVEQPKNVKTEDVKVNNIESEDDDVIFVADDKNSVNKVRSLSSVSPVSSQTSRSSRSNSPLRSRGRSRSGSRSRWTRHPGSSGLRGRRSRSRTRSRYRSSYRKSRSRERYRDRESRGSPIYRQHSPPPFHHYSRGSRKSYSRSRSRSRDRERRMGERDSGRFYKSYPSYRSENKPYDERYHHRPEEPPRGQTGGDRWRHLPRREEHTDGRQKEESDYRFKDMKKRDEGDKQRKIKWDEFEEELKKLESEMNESLKYYQSRPEKHPMYPEEWKSFWNRRYKELQQSGQDPSQYDFKPEWIVFWDKRMKEIHEHEMASRKEELRLKLNVEASSRKRTLSSDLQDISPPTPEAQKDVTVDDIKNTWKALTGSDITAPSAKRSPSPWEDSSSSPPPVEHAASAAPGSPRHLVNHQTPPWSNQQQQLQPQQLRPIGRKFYESVTPIVHCLRMLSVLENQLGSLGPRVLELLSKALALEKTKSSASMTLIHNRDIYILFDTVKEKLRGQLLAGVVMRHLVPPTRAVIKSIDNMLMSNPLNPEVFEPVKVHGVGMVDKVVVAQQIASALVAQGKTDVSQEELEELINAVVGMAKASNAKTATGMSSAAFFSQLDIQNSTGSSHINQILGNMIAMAQESLNAKKKLSAQANPPAAAGLAVNAPQPTAGQFKTPQPAPDPNDKKYNKISDAALKEGLMKFKDLPRDEQHRLIALLKELEQTQPERVEKLREFVTVSLSNRDQNKAESRQGRLSPFSMRSGGANPSPEVTGSSSEAALDKSKKMTSGGGGGGDSEDDDDYTIEDVYKAASENLRLNEREKQEQQNKNDNSHIPVFGFPGGGPPSPPNNLLMFPPSLAYSNNSKKPGGGGEMPPPPHVQSGATLPPPPPPPPHHHAFPLMPPPMMNNAFMTGFGDELVGGPIRKPEYPYQNNFKPF